MRHKKLGRRFGRHVGHRRLAVGMVLRVILGRADIDAGIAAGTLAGFAVAVGRLVGLRLLRQTARRHRQQHQKEADPDHLRSILDQFDAFPLGMEG